MGAGGAGEVFLARSKGGRLVAIKVLSEQHRGENAEVLAREASLCARLQHPTIVQVRAFLEDESFAALVFEYVAGVALARVVRFCTSRGVRLPDRAAWHIVERVLSALAYAHSFKDEQKQPTPIVHRDVSPSNVLLDWNGGVKLTDFGIAKMIGVSPSTRMGLVKGTLGCMAPEQARGEPVTERVDVYAAALLAWRLATGRVPFAKHQRDEYELLRAMRNPRIKPLSVLRPDLPEPLLDAVSSALEPDPLRRRIGAADFAAIVREHIDVDDGRAELAELLGRWKNALERSVKRQDPTTDGNDSADRAAHTMRYEEVALAFDEEEVAADGPTFEAHALPSDSSLLVAPPASEDDILALDSVAPPLPSASLATTPPPSAASVADLRAPERVPIPTLRTAGAPRKRVRPRTSLLLTMGFAVVAAVALSSWWLFH